MTCEYNWNVKNKAAKEYEEHYVFIMREDGVYYNELETRVRLSKRRLRAGQQQTIPHLVVKHRPLDKTEAKLQRYRDRLFKPPGEDTEEFSEDDDEKDLPETREKTDADRSRPQSKS